MADCSKTIDFYNERDRMCDSFANCKGCSFEIPDGACNTEQDIEYSIKIVQKLVQKWSDAHPAPKPKTYADDFFEKFPNAKRHENGRPIVCRCEVYDRECSYKKAPEVIYWRSKHGIDDCLTCWNEPYEDDNND